MYIRTSLVRQRFILALIHYYNMTERSKEDLEGYVKNIKIANEASDYLCKNCNPNTKEEVWNDEKESAFESLVNAYTNIYEIFNKDYNEKNNAENSQYGCEVDYHGTHGYFFHMALGEKEGLSGKKIYIESLQNKHDFFDKSDFTPCCKDYEDSLQWIEYYNKVNGSENPGVVDDYSLINGLRNHKFKHPYNDAELLISVKEKGLSRRRNKPVCFNFGHFVNQHPYGKMQLVFNDDLTKRIFPESSEIDELNGILNETYWSLRYSSKTPEQEQELFDNLRINTKDGFKIDEIVDMGYGFSAFLNYITTHNVIHNRVDDDKKPIFRWVDKEYGFRALEFDEDKVFHNISNISFDYVDKIVIERMSIFEQFQLMYGLKDHPDILEKVEVVGNNLRETFVKPNVDRLLRTYFRFGDND